MKASTLIIFCLIGMVICAVMIYFAATGESCDWCYELIDAIAYEPSVP